MLDETSPTIWHLCTDYRQPTKKGKIYASIYTYVYICICSVSVYMQCILWPVYYSQIFFKCTISIGCLKPKLSEVLLMTIHFYAVSLRLLNVLTNVYIIFSQIFFEKKVVWSINRSAGCLPTAKTGKTRGNF